MSRAAALRAVLLVAVLACCVTPLPAAPDEREPKLVPVRKVAKPQAALLDCRSLTVEHERRLALGSTWSLGGHGVRFELRKDKLALFHTPPGAETPTVRSLRAPPVLVPLKVFDTKYALSVRLARGGDAVWMASAYGVELKLGGEKAYVVDSNLDGDIGVGDGYVAPGSRTVAPWTGAMWTRKTAAAYRANAAGWDRLQVRMPFPENEDHVRAWRLLQWRRQQCGLLPVAYKAALETGIRLHADYCAENGYKGHDQDPDAVKYTAEGARAGRQSVLGFGIETLEAGMEQQLATLYHRNGLLQPALTHTAMALHRGVFGANVRDSTGGPLADCLIVVPPHGLQDAPRAFNPGGEVPMPVGGRQLGLAELGTSVGAFSASLERAQRLAEKPSLTVTKLVGSRRKRGASFRLDLYYPGKVPHAAVPASNFGNVALTPPRPLDARTTYACEIQLVLPRGTRTAVPPAEPFVYTWEFTTGR